MDAKEEYSRWKREVNTVEENVEENEIEDMMYRTLSVCGGGMTTE
jgi:hypothetical protein